jgi:hypothetical protein
MNVRNKLDCLSLASLSDAHGQGHKSTLESIFQALHTGRLQP